MSVYKFLKNWSSLLITTEGEKIEFVTTKRTKSINNLSGYVA